MHITQTYVTCHICLLTFCVWVCVWMLESCLVHRHCTVELTPDSTCFLTTKFLVLTSLAPFSETPGEKFNNSFLFCKFFIHPAPGSQPNIIPLSNLLYFFIQHNFWNNIIPAQHIFSDVPYRHYLHSFSAPDLISLLLHVFHQPRISDLPLTTTMIFCLSWPLTHLILQLAFTGSLGLFHFPIVLPGIGLKTNGHSIKVYWINI
jgi:hypothetical protein